MTLPITERPCACGSGEFPVAVHDARGIFVTYACSGCRKDRLAGYRDDIFTDPNYECDEPIEPEDGSFLGDW